MYQEYVDNNVLTSYFFGNSLNAKKEKSSVT